jgi:hypothetical protein
MRVLRWPPFIDFVAQPTNQNLYGFEAQTKKLSPKPGNPPPPSFWGSTKKPTTGFEAKLEKIVATGFEAKLEKTVVAGFEVKLQETWETKWTVTWFDYDESLTWRSLNSNPG